MVPSFRVEERWMWRALRGWDPPSRSVSQRSTPSLPWQRVSDSASAILRGILRRPWGPPACFPLICLPLLWVMLGAAAVEAEPRKAISQSFAEWSPQVTPPSRTPSDPDIPTLQEVVGHGPTERLTRPAEVVRYLEALAEAAPERTRLIRYGQSWQGRPLVMLAIAAPGWWEREEEVMAGLARLADPRGLAPAEAHVLVSEMPVVTALLHAVHGNEVTPVASALMLAHHLLAAPNDPHVARILGESVVLIDPLQNPDGRARFLAENALGVGPTPDSDPLAAERDHPWPGSRSNHYLFDLNRDWFGLTQVETRERVRELLRWSPHVVVDLHEMGSNSTYYFPPSAAPGNPHTTATQDTLFTLFGRENARVFDERGWPYFIREIFDGTYPGYGATWPTAHGALGKTFEQASPRGMVVERDDGAILSYADGAERNFEAALRTALTAAENRERILRSYLEFRRSAIAEGETGVRAYLLPPGRDPGLTRRLAGVLAANGIEVDQATESFSAEGRDFPDGTWIVAMDQPAGRLVRNLLDPETPMDPTFLALQEERRAQRLPAQIYDLTAWSLPYLWNVESVPVRSAVVVPRDRVPPALLDEAPGDGAAVPADLPPARVGWLLPWNSATAMVTAGALSAGISLNAAGGSFAVQGRDFGVGTILARAAELSGDDRRELARLAHHHGVEPMAVGDGFVDRGISLGSNQMRRLPGGRVLLLWDEPSSSQSAGWARWVLEQRYGLPVSVVRAGSLGRAQLSRYSVIVVPQGNFRGTLDGPLLDRLRHWIRDGGTLITMGESTRWAASEDVGLLATRAESRDRVSPPATEPGTPIDLLEAVTPEREPPESISGALLRVHLDPGDVLAAGAGTELPVLVSGTRIFSPLRLNEGRNVGVYAPLDDLVLSGVVWEEARPQRASKAFLVRQPLGRGRIIAFAEDPNFRGYAEGTQLLFMNAVLLAPAF
ncbi:MAG: peptidase [Gemmatimonadales bacterium]|nr:MAG: peptidase [Gemmatimonadales bacterium]